MSQTSVHSQTQQTSQNPENRSESFHIPDGPPQPHSREELAQLEAQPRHSGSTTTNDKKDSNSEQKPAVVGPDEELSNEKARELGLPEQTHAGKIGYGPEYFNMNHVRLSEKIQGVKEEVVGHIKRDPGLVTQGKERRTGELKKKEKEEKDNGPFADPGGEEHAGKQSPTPNTDGPTSQSQQQNANVSPATDQNNADPSTVKFANGQTNGSTDQPTARASIDSDRRQVQEEQQAGQTRDVDLKTTEGRLNPDEHKDKGIERAAEL